MTLPVDGIKLHRGNFAAIGQQIQPLLDAGQCFRLQVKPWREKRSLSQNALSHMWYTEISEYLIARGKTFATSELETGEMYIFLCKVEAWAMNIGCHLTILQSCEYQQLRDKQEA
ncbi:hypothetical protein ABKV78_15510 (plasmid) [Enterobacter asburiae]|uniref:hypothetical protein n=1 Tax=Enterobacter asburiae TaxID=61645 RepID=UPI0032AF755B